MDFRNRFFKIQMWMILARVTGKRDERPCDHPTINWSFVHYPFFGIRASWKGSSFASPGARVAPYSKVEVRITPRTG